jgi:periplasmic divalent cation tolerance protein
MSSKEDQAVLVYITTSDLDEARRIAGAVVADQLAACANILPEMESVYRWKGEVQSDNEVVLLLKSRSSLTAKITEKVNSLHSYDLPCVVTLPLSGGSHEFLNWITEQTSGEPD